MKVSNFAFALLFGFLVTTPVAAQDATFLSKHGAWTAHVASKGGQKTCFAWSKPTKSQGKYSSRGNVLAFVTVFNPAPQGNDYYNGGQVSLVAGYRYKPDSPIQASIGGKRFDMFSEDDTAWAASADGDQQLIGAMKAGATMVVRGTSWRPTKTTDTYSLKGFTAAYNAIRAACQ